MIGEPQVTRLPLPDADGIYTFPTDLLTAHRAWMDSLTGAKEIMTLTAPLTLAPYWIEPRKPSGRPVVVIEPHHDDFVLSASGTFLARPRPLTVVTVFTRSRSVHPSLESTYNSVETVSGLRDREAAQSLLPLGAARVGLGHKDAEKPYRAPEPAQVDRITSELAEMLDGMDDAELLAPAAVTRHPDHLAVHEATRRLGCRWFWEDAAFWSTYGLSGCDRQLFRQRVRDVFEPELEDITATVLDKVTLLHMHGSQMHPARKMYRPIRHAYTVAANLLPDPDGPPRGQFAERFYRLGGSW
ncbi:PIG-L deacetylase family protein [Streptomyces vinaceus]|uniref:PIG-L deacetylase family protein n=1 Tax=Streptomyces vinaceus TaxID=1960 RepID=UPI00167C03D7|nr:PIG-L family deacetylase [Streptomyces vinaceus]